MMKRTHTYSLLAGSLLALALVSTKSQAENTDAEWSNLGYSHPEAEQLPPIPKVADIAPENKANSVDEEDEIATTISSAELMNSDPAAAVKINTVQNTYEMTNENKRTTEFYASPFAGGSSVISNDTVSSSPRYSAGVSLGALILPEVLVQVTYVHSENNLSNPTFNNTGMLLLDNSMRMSQNSIGGGGRYFILGRSSRVRPYAGLGLNFVRSSLTYNGNYATTLDAESSLYSNRLTLNQFNGYGELGAEVAITRNIVGSLNLQVNGVLSSAISSDSTVDGTRAAIANSLGRSASYTAGAGLGIYF